MIEIPLTRGQHTTVDDQDADLASGRAWQASVTRGPSYAYQRDLGARKDPRTLRYMHRIIMARILGRDLDKGECVDHVDGNGLNNTRRNLRLATHTQNLRNLRKVRAKTGFKGVVMAPSGKFIAYCGISGGPRYLGLFKTAAAAARAYDEAANTRDPRFSVTNKEIGRV